jgi:hypothetical protein
MHPLFFAGEKLHHFDAGCGVMLPFLKKVILTLTTLYPVLGESLMQ